VQVKEQVIMIDVHKHPIALANATKVYVEATSSSFHFLIVENERMAKELHTNEEGGDLVTMSARAKLKKAILDEVLSLDMVMRALYSKFGIVHKAVIHLNRWQQRCARRACILMNLHVVVDDMQTWMMKYKGDPFHLPKRIRINAIELKAHI